MEIFWDILTYFDFIFCWCSFFQEDLSKVIIDVCNAFCKKKKQQFFVAVFVMEKMSLYFSAKQSKQ